MWKCVVSAMNHIIIYHLLLYISSIVLIIVQMGPGCTTFLPPNTLNNNNYLSNCMCHVFEVISSVLTWSALTCINRWNVYFFSILCAVNCLFLYFRIILFYIVLFIVFVFATVVEYIFLQRPLVKYFILLRCVD